MPSLLQPSLRQSELKDLLGVLLFFILLKDGGKCGIGACELRPHPPHATPLCWSCFGTAEKHIPGPLHHPLCHGDERSSGRSQSSNNSLGTTKWFRCGRLLVSLLRRKFIAGGVLSAILTTSPPRFLAAIALA